MANLNGTLPELQRAYAALSSYGAGLGISFSLADYGGLRSQSDTTSILGFRDADYALAKSAGTIRPDTTLNQFRPIAPFGTSWHNYGAAFDINIVAHPSSMTGDQALNKLGAYAPSIGLRWGGNFSNPDRPHFELAISLSDARTRYASIAGGSSGGNIVNLLPAPDVEESSDTAGYFSNDVTDSGDSAAAIYDDGSGPDSSFIVLGLLVAGVVAWAIHKKFLT